MAPDTETHLATAQPTEYLLNKITTLLLTALAFYSGFGSSRTALSASPGNAPNVLIIYTDDQGYGDASCLNDESKFQTPGLDRLAREGMTLTNGHCSDTVCTPSRYGLLAGRYSWRTTLKSGVFGAEEPCLLPDDRVNLASLLKENGYRTGMVGKWHLGMDFPGTFGERDWSKPTRDMPLDKGFDYFFGIPASMNFGVLAWFEGRYPQTPPMLFTDRKPTDLAMQDFRFMPPYDQLPPNKKAVEVAPDFIDTACLTRFTEKAIEFIDTSAGSEKPFFLYLPYTSPHKPVVPLPEFRGQGEAGGYGEFMIETDYHIGRVLDALDQQELTENTLVIFSSDNGPENTYPERVEKYGHDSAGPYRGGKRDAYEGGHRVPFFVRWPAVVKPGTEWDGPVCQTDVLATVAEILDVELPEDAGEDSVSFLPVLRGAKKIAIRPAMVHHESNGRFAVRDTIDGDEWKLLMEYRRDKRELYNVTKDPAEKENLVSKRPEIVEQLKETLTRIVISGRSVPGPHVGNDTGWWDNLTWIPEDEYTQQ
ncbi:sulfatase family protein [Rubinisphaera margarita]|uniref:sulfatase family protein n=1 Tax=Rubinisphaera margarita TaxID=2909586 RepID=UPI001EE99C4F|nr:arylsulfatase [Rubinisphaera margarita]MCG6158028.1 arylsulfatase [Rubinisphaera margarita]